MSKLRVLVKGWTQIPHSYSMVNCFQIVHLLKGYGDKVELFIDEQEYFRPEWNNVKKLVYGEEYNNMIRSLKKWEGEDIDIVYSITYPYDIREVKVGGVTKPKCVFYTSEFAWLDKQYFKGTFVDLQTYIKSHKELYFTAPSIWSAEGLKMHGVGDERNRVITHGVDPSIFKLDESKVSRVRVREFYKFKESDIVMVNIGAMTENKGIMLVLQALHELVNKEKQIQYKLLLKGTGDLYQSKLFLESYFEKLQRAGVMSVGEVAKMMNEHIVFTDKTMGYNRVNDLLNASDVYISPYLAEGFNLTVLESLCAGLPVIVPENGSTHEYIEDIKKHGGKEYVMHVASLIGQAQCGRKQNVIGVNDLVQVLLLNSSKLQEMKTGRYTLYTEMREYISQEYSWSRVADLLYEYMTEIVNGNIKS